MLLLGLKSAAHVKYLVTVLETGTKTPISCSGRDVDTLWSSSIDEKVQDVRKLSKYQARRPQEEGSERCAFHSCRRPAGPGEYGLQGSQSLPMSCSQPRPHPLPRAAPSKNCSARVMGQLSASPGAALQGHVESSVTPQRFGCLVFPPLLPSLPTGEGHSPLKSLHANLYC